MRGALPKDAGRVDGPPLASPDQRWAVAQSRAREGKVTLWLLEIQPKPAPEASPREDSVVLPWGAEAERENNLVL